MARKSPRSSAYPNKTLLAAALIATACLPEARAATTLETLSYHDNESSWILGQVATRAINGVLADQTTFDPVTSRPTQFLAFGKLTQSLGYNADGTIAYVRDGNGNTIALSSWKRGVPQLISFPGGTTQSAVVDDHGWISQVTDQNGFSTGYRYDAMGRVAGVDYPSGDSTAWSPMNQNFVQVMGDEYGVAAGHWRKTTTTGNRVSIAYYDALWRPLIVSEYDAADPGTIRFTGKEYDNEGRTVFSSYPAATANSDRGTWTVYDALGRTTSVTQNSELGDLTTSLSYLRDASGVFTLTRNPRGAETRTWYRMLDQPSFDSPTRILQPEGALTVIDRDAFGKPLSIRRSSADGSLGVTRAYSYNAAQELCRTVEPETGATLAGYDGAGNVAWSASGLPSSTGCEPDGNSASVAPRRVSRSYDARNRLLALSFPDGNGDQIWSYIADGKVAQVTTRNDAGSSQVVNTYSYNKRRLVTGESIEQTGMPIRSAGYVYDAHASLSGVHYPSGLSVDYAPNALGQPTRAGTFVSSVTYFPNGGMSRFVYGNGIVHTMQQNGRQLPASVSDAGVLSNTYGYDATGNVAQITDGLNAARTRSMTYDSQDRLLSTHSTAFGGNGQLTYSYDALDNIRTVRLEGLKDLSYWYDVNNRLTNIINSSGSTVVGLAFDVQGNVSVKNGQGFQFDYGNRLRTAVGKESYRYDSSGRRVLSSADSGTIASFYGNDGVLRRQDNDRTASSVEYVYLNGSLVAKATTSTAPATPVISAPAQSSSGNYTVSWSEVAQTSRYDLQEQAGAGAWSNIYSGPDRTREVTGRAGGSYGYRVRGCRATACGGWSATAITSVQSLPSAGPSVNAPGLSIDGNYSVSWPAVAGAQTYRLEESTTGSGWAEIQNDAILSRSFVGKPNGTFAYRARACNAAGCGEYGATASVQVLRVPESPAGLSAPALSANGSYTVSWSPVSGSSAYHLEESSGGSAWIVAATGAATAKEFSQKPDGSYAYRVSACNSSGCGPSTGPATVRVVRAPTGSSSLSGTTLSNDGSVALSWSPVSLATTYRLFESVSGGAWNAVLNSGSTSATLTGRANGSLSYSVAACNDGGCGPQGPALNVVVMRPPSEPALSGPGSSGTGSYTISWNAVDRASSYVVEESANGGGWTAVYSGGSTSAVISGRGDGTYAYRVAACNQGGCSGYSGSVAVAVNVPPVTPTGLTARFVVTNAFPPWQVRYFVSWNAVAGAAWYEVTGRGTYTGSATSVQIDYTGVPAGATFQVRACKPIGCSAWTPAVSATGG
ncbi:TPA: wall-associated protein [Stenotrophomonas maltophilia]